MRFCPGLCRSWNASARARSRHLRTSPEEVRAMLCLLMCFGVGVFCGGVSNEILYQKCANVCVVVYSRLRGAQLYPTPKN